MTSDRAIEALRRHRVAESEVKRQQVLRAIEDFIQKGEAITIAAVARAAGVSREFIHSHSNLRESVTDAARTARDRREAEITSDTDASARSLQADRLTLIAEVQRLRRRLSERDSELVKLKDLRKRWLGSQLPDPNRVDPEAHAELRNTNERLIADKANLTARVSELGRLASALESDLAAARQALAEELAGASLQDNVTILRPSAPRS